MWVRFGPCMIVILKMFLCADRQGWRQDFCGICGKRGGADEKHTQNRTKTRISKLHDQTPVRAVKCRDLWGNVVFLLGFSGALLGRALVPPAQQSAGDDVGLNFRSPFEDVEDAGVAEHARYGVFEGVAVAAVDLQRVVGV